MRILFLVVFFLTPLSFARGPQRGLEKPFSSCLDSERRICEIREYANLRLSSLIEKSHLRALLQQTYNELRGVGFRFMGHDADFFHGHFLYNQNFQGVLYHTQELAALYERKDPDHPYSYLDPEKRNWFQFVESHQIVDASHYISQEGRESQEFSGFRDSYTVNQRMLHTKKLTGQHGNLKALQFLFYKVACPESPFQQTNIIKIQGASESFCMIIN